jgi:hypothetical protein
VEFKTEYDWCELQTKQKKMWLGQLASPVCNNGDRPAQERQREKSLLNGGFNDVDDGAGCCELNEWQVSILWCFLPSLLSQSTLDLLAKFVLCQTPGG